jgi:hypothetical protein
MNSSLRIVAIGLLSFVGFTALYGGWALMIDPSGGILNMPVDKMRFSPFDNYFIPGLILFVVLGWGSLLLLPILVKRKEKTNGFLILAGMTLSGGITVQMIMMGEINWLHHVYLIVGLTLLFLGMCAKSKAVH